MLYQDPLFLESFYTILKGDFNYYEFDNYYYKYIIMCDVKYYC